MHPQFKENGQLYHLDVNMNPTTLPVGKFQMVRQWSSGTSYMRADKYNESYSYGGVIDEPDFDGSK